MLGDVTSQDSDLGYPSMGINDRIQHIIIAYSLMLVLKTEWLPRPNDSLNTLFPALGHVWRKQIPNTRTDKIIRARVKPASHRLVHVQDGASSIQ